MSVKRWVSIFIAAVLAVTAAPAVLAAAPADGIYVNNSYDDGKDNALADFSDFAVYNADDASKAAKGVTEAPDGSKPGKVYLIETLPGGKVGPNMNSIFSGKAGIIYGSDVPVLVIESNIRIENTGVRRALFGLRDDLDYMPYLAVIDGGKFKLCDNSLTPIAGSEFADCEENTWYHVLAKVDLINRMYDFYIDGEQVLFEEPLYATADVEGEKGLFNQCVQFIRTELPDWDGYGAKTYFDDYKVYAFDALEAPSVSGVQDLSQTSYLARTIDLQFATAMDKGALNPDEITVTKADDGTVVPYTAELVDAYYYRLAFDEHAFESETAYNINFSENVTDVFGNGLEEDTLDMFAKNSPPTVTATFGAGAYIKAGSDFTLTATAEDMETAVESVSFYSGDTKIGDAVLRNGVYTYEWTNLAEGRYEIYAQAVDTDGVIGISDTVTVNVVSMTPIIETAFDDTSGWLPYTNNGTIDVVPDPLGLNGNSIRLNIVAGTEGNPNANKDFTSQPYTGLIYYSFQVLPTTGIDSGIEVKDGGNVSSILLKFSSSGELRNAQDTKIGTYTPGTWQDVTIIWDTNSTDYTVWVNGTQYDLQLKNALANFGYLRIYAWGPATLSEDTAAYFDNMNIYTVARRPDVASVTFVDGDGSVTDDASQVPFGLQKICLTFADNMNAETVNASNITLEAAGQTPVATTGSYDAASKTYTITLLEMPERLSEYTIVIHEAVETADKLPLLDDLAIGYTMADAPVYAQVTGYQAGGRAVSSASQLNPGDTLLVDAQLINHSGESQNALLIIAIWKNGELIGAGYQEESLAASEEQKDTQAAVTIPSAYTAGCSVTTFVWDSVQGMNPLAVADRLS